MHRLARRLATPICSNLTNAARLPANTRCGAVLKLPTAPTLERRIHVRVPLPYNVEDGMGEFLPPAALKVIAEDYQQGLLDRLNEQIKGAPPARSQIPAGANQPSTLAG
jgi:superoxide dismutase, Fe-Mn family